MPALLAATWKTAMPSVELLYPKLAARALSPEDALEQLCMYVEDEPGEHSVGYSGLPNSEGVVELDAAFMEGAQLTMGGVAGLVGFRNPVCAARMVMERTPHSLLIGQGANDFAARMGCARREMRTEESMHAYFERLNSPNPQFTHDTVGAIALSGGHIAVATSTSGLFFKLPGRVSDSAMPGCGYWADDQVGAAVATGVGEHIMKGCLCMRAVDALRAGLTPQQAAERVMREVLQRVSGLGNMAVLVADMRGRFGGAASHGFFTVSIGSDEQAPDILPMPNVRD